MTEELRACPSRAAPARGTCNDWRWFIYMHIYLTPLVGHMAGKIIDTSLFLKLQLHQRVFGTGHVQVVVKALKYRSHQHEISSKYHEHPS